MMKARLLTILIFIPSMIFLVKAHSSQLNIEISNINIIKNNYDCFSSEFSSYDSWVKFLSLNKERQFKRQKIENVSEKIDEFVAGFEKMFPRKQYDLAKENLDCRFIKYTVGKNEVNGVLIIPKSPLEHEGKIPVVIYNRGGTRNLGSLVFGHLAYELFPIAQKGFAIIASDYRADEQYGADNIDEVTALFEILENIPKLNSYKVGVYGISRGGLTSWQLAKKVPNRIAAVVTLNGVTDFKSWSHEREGIAHNLQQIEGYNINPDEVLTKLSPLKWVSEISDAPILLLHSRDDERVNIMQSLRFSEELIKSDKFFRMKIFENGGHSLTEHKSEAINDTVLWFSRYVK